MKKDACADSLGRKQLGDFGLVVALDQSVTRLPIETTSASESDRAKPSARIRKAWGSKAREEQM
jgi:hypothetical protein